MPTSGGRSEIAFSAALRESRCVARGGTRRVSMTFFLRNLRLCQFLEPELKTPLPRKLNFWSAEKINQLAERSATSLNLEARQSIDHAIAIGAGQNTSISGKLLDHRLLVQMPRYLMRACAQLCA